MGSQHLSRHSLKADGLGELDPLRPSHIGVAKARQEDDDRFERGVADGPLLDSSPSTCSQRYFLISAPAQQCALSEQPLDSGLIDLLLSI